MANYCPLLFLGTEGTNLTPDKLRPKERADLEEACDGALRRLVSVLAPSWVVGVGAYAERRARTALADLPVRFGSLPHPSPANPAANRGWEPLARAALAKLGISLP